MTMSGPDHLIRSLGIGDQILDHRAILLRHVVADSIWNVQSRRTSLDNSGEDLAQKVLIASSCIFGGEFYIVNQGLCKRYCGDGAGDAFFAGDFEFMLEMNVRGREEGVNALVRCLCNGVVAALDIGRDSTSETRDNLLEHGKRLKSAD